MKFSDILREYLLESFPDAKLASGGKEVTIRCRFCGDSKKSKSSRHLYLSLGNEELNEPPMYHCFKCDDSGVLSKEVIRDLMGTNDNSDVLYELNKRNTKVFQNSKYRPNKNNSFTLKWDIESDDSIFTQKKLQYLDTRVGKIFSYQIAISNKIILDIKKVLEYNNIEVKEKYLNFIDYASKYCIGFLSMNNSFITLRNLLRKPPEEFNFRYMHYNIFGSYEAGLKYYCIPAKIDILDPNPVHIRIAEGPMDILSVFYNLCNEERTQNIYLAANGKGFNSIIKYILTSYPLSSIIIDLYLDNDFTDDYVIPISLKLKNIGIPVYIHRNLFRGEKDFGVPVSNILERVRKL